MAYKNFIPTVWAETIERNLERAHVFATDTNKKYEGTVKKMGDTVRILGVGSPTITEQVGGKILLEEYEEVEDSAVSMTIDRVAFYNFGVDDIDKAQSANGQGVLDALTKEASEGIADKQDKAIAELSKDPLAVLHNKSAETVTKENVLDILDIALQKLSENDVKLDSNLVAIIPPWFYRFLKQGYAKLDTNNSKILENGLVGKYGNLNIRVSNNVAKSKDGASLIQVRTDRAIAYACPLIHTEPYRPEKSFTDAVKGFALYGRKIVRPKEMIVLNVKGA